MKIAVVGGDGFIGREFVNYAKENGHRTVIIEKDCDAFSDSGAEEITTALKSCDAMVFLAAKRLTSAFSISEYLYNVGLAERYLLLAQVAQMKNIVLTSSINVYSSPVTPWKEDEFQAPASLYGASKLAVDSIALLYNGKYGMKIKSLRLAQVIGMGERKGYLLNTLIDNAIAGRNQVIYGQGTGRRQYIYIKDVCDAMLHSVVKESETAGVFNIGIQGNASIAELAAIINRAFENRAETAFLTDKPEDTKEYLMDVSKAEKKLHWKPRFDLEQSFADIRDYGGNK